MYDADDERHGPSTRRPGHHLRFDRWTLRDLGGKTLRTYEASGYNWTGSVAEDDIYRDGQLLAAEGTWSGTRHFHLDHLGTPRLITNSGGGQAAYVYYPFGAEATAFNPDTERLKFTGHERDLASSAGQGGRSGLHACAARKPGDGAVPQYRRGRGQSPSAADMEPLSLYTR